MARKIKFFEFDEGDAKANTKDVYLSRVRINPEGMDLTEMQERLSIMAKIRGAEDSVILEDAEWRRLRDIMKAQKWSVASEDIVNLLNAVNDAETVKLEEVA